MDNKTVVLIAVRNHLATNPNDFTDIINAATEGVRMFAERQTDVSSKLAYRISDIISETPNWKTKHFPKNDILDNIEPWFRGTDWLKEHRDKI